MSRASGISLDDVSSATKDAVYTAVGLGILGVNHVQAQRRQLQRQVEDTVRAVTETLTERVERAAGHDAGDR